MIQIQKIRIQQFRGIRDLTLDPDGNSFAIQGPNGSGKSGVVDAIDFGLTGDISRLTGKGTGGLTVKQHGPHVDVCDKPAEARVELTVFLTKLNKSATITRSVKKPRQPDIQPAEADIIAALEEVSRHPEIALSRRQIVRFILTEATNRSKDVQELLRLDRIEKNRAVLKTASNKCDRSLTTANKQAEAAGDALTRHLGVSELDESTILPCVNQRRQALGVSPIETLSANTDVMTELDGDAANPLTAINPSTAIADLKALTKALTNADTKPAIDSILSNLAKMDANPELHVALRRQQLVETGLDLLESDECPLCDAQQDEETLRTHLKQKLKLSLSAAELFDEITRHASAISIAISSLCSLIEATATNSRKLGLDSDAETFSLWRQSLIESASQLESVDGIMAGRDKLSVWQTTSPAIDSALEKLTTHIEQLPKQSSVDGHRDFLVVASERLAVWHESRKKQDDAQRCAQFAKTTYKAFCEATDSVLGDLYNDVQAAFIESYRAINSDDEGGFTASLNPLDGKLELGVDFHRRGEFHPGAYHSEGHQDGMGLCLYLALMKQLFGDQFRLVVLDDVVMSVDTQHRKQLCRLLKEKFPDTQFIITTHDKAWFHQMQSAKLISRRTCVRFSRWSVDHGPSLVDGADTWEEIHASLNKDDVPAAAARLRRHLEFVSAELAGLLKAKVTFEADGNHDLGELWSGILSRFNKLLSNAADSANRWNHKDDKKAVADLKARFKEVTKATSMEQWAMNKAVHFNAWADFVLEDFVAVVQAYEQFLDCFRCPHCASWLYQSPRKGTADTLRCDCNRTSFNLTRPDVSYTPPAETECAKSDTLF